MKRSLATKIFLVVLAPAMILSYSNCSRAPLTKPPPIYSSSGKATVCLHDYKPVAHYYRNLNLSQIGDQFALDTDGDGIPDDLEAGYGFDPLRRRTYGAILDSVCLYAYGGDKKECAKSKGITCSPAEYSSKYLGMSECDIKAIEAKQNAKPNSYLTGWDTDLDGIPDFIELIVGTNPLVADNFGDLDSDGVTNAAEISAFRNPNFADDHNTQGIFHSSLVSALDTDCTGDSYVADLDKAPLAKLEAYKSEEFSQLSHGTDDNVYLFTLSLVHKSKPDDPLLGHRFIYKIFNVKVGDKPFTIKYEENPDGPVVEEINDGATP